VTSEIVGRDEELAALHAFLGRGDDGPRALVLEGEAGIGKSTLWLAAVDAARERGYRVLASRPSEAEQGLAFVGLGDLFDGVVDEVLPALATPRRRALEQALLLGEAEERADPHALGVAVRNALQLLTSERPLAVAADDLQWLDRSSSSALAFALRRLDLPLFLLLARRPAKGVEQPELERALDRDAITRVPVGALSMGAIGMLLQKRLDRVFARPTLIRIHETSGGNPFYALEIARALGPVVDPTQPLQVPETLEELVGARLAELPSATRDALVLVAALGARSTKLLHAAGVGPSALEPALAARIVEPIDGSLRFTHPLLASVLYQSLPGETRRHAHRILADVVVDPLERARHLALSAAGPDAEIAAALEDAAAVAGSRGAMVLAAELGEHALRLTPAAARQDEERRTMTAARAHLAAGEVDRARALGRVIEERVQEGSKRAEALIFLSELESGRLADRIALRRAALREPSTEPRVRLLAHQRLALELRFTEGVAAAQEHAQAAVELATELGDDGLRAGALASLSLLRFTAGEGDAIPIAEQACELASLAKARQRLVDARFCLAHALVWSADLVRARVELEGLNREGAERDERVSSQALWYLSLVELQGGRWTLAAEYAERARELSLLYVRHDAEDPQNVFPLGLVAAHQGNLEGAHELAERGHVLAERQSALLPGLPALRGLVYAWQGDTARATERFAEAEGTADAAGWGEPGLRWWRADYVEALLAAKRVDEAIHVTTTWERATSGLEREWVLAQALRCRGRIEAARGRVEDAAVLLAQAADRHELAGDRFGRARALLALGTTRRRIRQKRAAREAIDEALAVFEELGAALWAEHARAELGRIGGRRREEGLTPAERRVATLVAEGRTNREVAAALVLGERTVETHLTHIYAKLGVRSRTELARTLDSQR
jgi:DNA-binding CsgD family transcriptional regulator